MSTPTFFNIFPQSTDQAGRNARIKVQDVFPVSDAWGPVMRPDEFGGFDGEKINGYNISMFSVNVAAGSDGQVDPSGYPVTFMSTFLNGTISNLSSIIRTELQNTINSQLSQLFEDGEISQQISFRVTHADILKTGMQTTTFGPDAKVYLYWVYDIVVYGQYTPNPLANPAPPVPTCEQLTGYQWLVAYPIRNPDQGLASVDPLAPDIAVVDLFPKGGGTGVNFSTACVFGFAIDPPVAVGEYYTIRVQCDPLLAGTTLDVTITPLNENPQTITLTDAGTDVYLLFQMQLGSKTTRVATAPQSPSAGENTPSIKLSLFTSSC